MRSETATLGGGCFWCLEAVFENLRGVERVASGYAGGDVANPSYQQVCTGATGHAEVVQVTFDPSVISYREVLEVFFGIHDPTTLNRQGMDVGTQYRSAIFYHSPEQQQVAEQAVAELSAAGIWDRPIVTQVVPFTVFYPAEGYHQDFLVRNPTYPYIVWNDLPKIEDLKRLFPAAYRADPVLVAQAKKSG